jgi:DNA (cytosine-5)-methyltransferase 1
MIPVIDLFAGPGGLGEGFSAFYDSRGRHRFKLALSIEKDPHAHATLRLRAFRRLCGATVPTEYERLLRGEIMWKTLKERYKTSAANAEAEAQCIELSADTVDPVRSMIAKALPENRPWVLIGGPPCQAYSLVGRARNKGNADYHAELDHRQTLYVEYLQILADHAPPVFVMENVKGLLSAQLNRDRIFDRMRNDLRDPAKALRRENRHTCGTKPRYEIHALVPPLDLLGDDPAGYVVRAECFGVPQRRHRVILLGVRQDFGSPIVGQLIPQARMTNVAQTLKNLPRVRSGLSKEQDSDGAWIAQLLSFRKYPWLRKVDEEVRRKIENTLDSLLAPKASRGADYAHSRSGPPVLNHSTRGHIVPDLERYLFASSFAAVSGYSPVLSDFPEALLPKHANVALAMDHGMFADRFRVQVAHQPASTITSHISKDGHYYIHPDPSQCRSLTVREAARLQTFPDDYFFCGPRTAQYQQVGNAVPPTLARQIAAVVADLISD